VSDPLAAVREGCARVAGRARFVAIDEEGLQRWVDALPGAPAPTSLDPAHHHLGDAEQTLAYVITLDAINFGSGWFPELRKRPGLSGYFTVATSLKERFVKEGSWSAAELGKIDADRCERIFGQQGNREVRELMELFAAALRDLGEWLETRHGGSFAAAIDAAGGRAARLVDSLAEMPLYRDVAHHAGERVAFYKRAQLTAADLSAAFAGSGPGAFADLDRLTIFADNLVPHVLRREGVLVYEAGLAERIDTGARLPAGSPEEVEVRALAVHAVERAVAALGERRIATTAQALDYHLWNRGQRPEIKAHPRHRTRCPYY
jgi:Queuosine salvage protein